MFENKKGEAMGVNYIVLALLPNEKDRIVAWLSELGIACPAGESRYPSIEELRSVLDHLEGYTICYNTKIGDWYADISQTDLVAGDWTVLLVSNYKGNDPDPHEFSFRHGSPLLMLRILQRLARTCGPLILFPDTGDLPLVVTPELDLTQALHAWD
jgi:hypothetical protein